MDAIPAGSRAGQQQHIPGPVGGRAGQVFDAGDPHAHGVDQRVLRIAVVEVNLSGHVGNADAVAIPAYPIDHALQQPAVGGGVRRAKAQGVEQGDGACAHGQDVANDASNTGGRALQRLYRGGMVVGFHLEHHRQSVSNIDGPSVLGARL